MSTEQEVHVVLKDVIVDGIPSVEFGLEVSDGAQHLKEPTPAMWVSIYLANEFNKGRLMKAVEAYVASGATG